jgi:polysaccharide biosynthesis protein PslG
MSIPRQRVVLAALLAALAMVLPGCTTPYQAPPLPPDPFPSSGELPAFGAQFHGTWADYSQDERVRVLRTLADHSVTDVRIDVSWNMLQPDGPDGFHEWGFQQVDNAIRTARAEGMRVLVTLWMAPQWANDSTNERVPPTSATGLAGLTKVAKKLAVTYKGTVDAWEVWNEPNHPAFFVGTDPVQYAQVLKAAYAGFKQGDPDSTVVFGGTAYSDVPWIRQALDAGALGHFDVMAVHPYPAIADEPPDTPDDGTADHFTHVVEVRRLMLDRGLGSMPLWFTEWCYRGGENSPTTPNHRRKLPTDKQIAYSIQALEMMRTQWPFVTRAYWYEDRAYSDDPARRDNGLVYPSGKPTPVLSALDAHYRSTPGVATSSAGSDIVSDD